MDWAAWAAEPLKVNLPHLSDMLASSETSAGHKSAPQRVHRERAVRKQFMLPMPTAFTLQPAR